MDESEMRDAFETEMGYEEEVNTSTEETTTEDAPAPDPASEQEEGAEVEKEEQESSDKPEPEPESEPDGEPEAPQYATKDDIREAFREYNQDVAKADQEFTTMQKEIVETLYPEGVNDKLYDSDGKEIKSAQDIIDRGLLNPETGQEFDSYEEAASWILMAQQQVHKNIEGINEYVTEIAETNKTLKEGADRVKELWGDIFEANPEVRDQVLNSYMKTLVQENGLFVKAPVDIVEYYNIAMAPYKQLQEAMARNAEYEEAAKKQEAENEKDERMGIPSRGTSKTKPNTGDKYLDAFLEEMGE